MSQKWSRLIRFISNNGKVYTGDALLVGEETNVNNARHARVIIGNPFGSYTLGKIRVVHELLAPMTLDQVRTIRCLGLNYRTHAHEAGMKEPEYPVLFYKPPTAVGGPRDHIPVPPMAQIEGTIDYEAELVAVIGRQCRYVTESQALEYVAGYTVGNDVSQREWQIKRGGSQWNVGKMFDGWAPIGPAIVAANLLDPVNLKISSSVNGELRQSDSTSNMIFGVAKTISWLSQGCTLMPGDLIFFGTPAGVGMGFKPPRWLANKDVVECSIEGIGTIRNRVHFQDAPPPEPVTLPPFSKKTSRSRKLLSKF
ncbi:Fumarylacetoacetate hydrolase domain-containing protein 2 [Wickerhamiella sorbophila]|uniref:Fumarylacetoacetate hydrolase domain-containing protein 2 n=1 Tax=Wickerhamiella sorbophila TaxID=45607 RepID=A0A2T0FMN7_9ASCO|nr:Fumarylacetoacetate hydrolase domain-containing protein 2 [Wickerhamiella sorbophila]PRT56237.1 Fumarylacetoacetate hydrolase domain-containing protein 2 [Wickerhamiella sorbophila]